MKYHEYEVLKSAISSFALLLDNFFVGSTKETTKEAVECFSDDQKTFLDGLVQRRVNDHLIGIRNQVADLFKKLNASSANVLSVNEKIEDLYKRIADVKNDINDSFCVTTRRSADVNEKHDLLSKNLSILKEDNLRIEGLVIEYNRKITKHILDTDKTWISTQNTVNNLDSSVDEFSKKLDSLISVATEYRGRILALEKIHHSR